ncbi:MAG: VWA domain-containing protein [Planctomycetes bacterium]|nr:VWA domain-containing protein [Planctomycetota bacterium]
MNTAFEWLLGLERIRLDADSPISLRFATAPAAWIMLIGAVVAAIMVFRLYRRQRVASRWRWALMGLRFGVIMTALFIISRPTLVLQRNDVDPSVVAVLLDTSASMETADAASNSSRWNAARGAVLSQSDGMIRDLIQRQTVELWSFDSSAERIGRARRVDEIPHLISEAAKRGPSGGRTDLSASVLQVLDAMRGDRLAGLVVVSDGRQSTLSSLETALGAADARAVPIHAMAVGSDRPRLDAEAISAFATEDVFVQDPVRVQMQLEFRGLDGSTPFLLELIDKTNGEVLASRAGMADGVSSTWRGELVYRAMSEGRRVLTARVAPLSGEENTANNGIDLAITAHDAKVSVLYVESEPRYEYRYLKNLLIREQTLESSCLLLSATPGFTQEGTRPISRFPRSAEDLGRYDVVILGDVDPRGDWMSPVQESMLVDFVSEHGGGIAFIAGERSMPQRLKRTKLAKLLPVRIAATADSGNEADLIENFVPKITVEGLESGIFASNGGGGADVNPMGSMPGWYWHADVDGPQAGAVILASHPSARGANGPAPLAVLGRFGAGKTFYLGSDDLWRWRQHGGDGFYNQTWLQILRTLARGRRFGREDGMRIETDRRRYELGREVRVELIAGAGAEVLPARPTILVRDYSDNLTARIELVRAGAGSNRARGEFTPARAGAMTLALEEPVSARKPGSVKRTIEVFSVDRERDRPEADPAFLRTIAETSGGLCLVEHDDWSRLAAAIPDRSMQIPADVEESIWDTRLILVLFTVLIAAEWIIRKGIGLK